MKKVLILFLALISFVSMSSGAFASSNKGLSESKAKEMVLEAREHYWNVMTGGALSEEDSECVVESFEYKGMDYRYLCEGLDTKKELMNYLKEVYTVDAINKGLEKYRFIEHEGKMAQPNADGGSILQWENATVELIKQKKKSRMYEFTVPFGDPVEYQKQKVTFVKVKGKWKLNEFDVVK